MTTTRRLAAFAASLLLLIGCRLDVTVELVVDEDGVGALTVTATVDADVVEQVPGLAEDLRFDDAVTAGWVVEGPASTPEGGLTVTLRHSVSSADEATNLLASLGPPFTDVRLTRTTEGDTTTNDLTGQLTLTDGFDSFADAELLTAVGGTPFADELEASGATPEGSMSVRFRTTLPGDVEATTGTEVDDALEWTAPLDGTAQDVATQTVQRPAPTWASILSVVALVLLVVWVLLAGAFLVSVVRVRRRRAARRDLGATSARRLEELDERRTVADT